MELVQMAKEYRQSIGMMQKRVEELEMLLPSACPTAKMKLRRRIRLLNSMMFEAMQIAIHLENY